MHNIYIYIIIFQLELQRMANNGNAGIYNEWQKVENKIFEQGKLAAPVETTFVYFIREQIENEYMEADETYYTAISYNYPE